MNDVFKGDRAGERVGTDGLLYIKVKDISADMIIVVVLKESFG